MRLTNAHLESFVARIAGVNIPTNKRVEIALQYIHGIGPAAARAISASASGSAVTPSASLTLGAQTLSRRAAKLLVKVAGMCWVMTVGGQFEGAPMLLLHHVGHRLDDVVVDRWHRLVDGGGDHESWLRRGGGRRGRTSPNRR
mgnify:CR=1 FL=1